MNLFKEIFVYFIDNETEAYSPPLHVVQIEYMYKLYLYISIYECIYIYVYIIFLKCQ